MSAAPDRDILEAYREWLFYEGRLLGQELYAELGDDAHRYVPHATLAGGFHFPSVGSWRDRPPPSARAELVLRAVGVLPEKPKEPTS